MDKTPIGTFANWPKTKTGRPLFTCSEDAIFYAQLIWEMQEEQDRLLIYRDDLYIKLRHERERNEPNWQHCMNLAVQAQFCRECLEECQRIKDEPYTQGRPIKKRFNTDIQSDEEENS